MADEQYDSLQLVGRHVPDVSNETNSDGDKVKVPLPGLYQMGVMLGGKFFPIATAKAGNYVDEKNVVQTGKGASQSDSESGEQDTHGNAISALSDRLRDLEAKLSGGDESQADPSAPPAQS